MKTKSVTRTIEDFSLSNLENLIVRLGEVRAETNAEIKVALDGDDDFGYRIKLTYERAMTEEEVRHEASIRTHAENVARERRRNEYEKLRKEFDGELE
jgi:hypothetical protein